MIRDRRWFGHLRHWRARWHRYGGESDDSRNRHSSPRSQSETSSSIAQGPSPRIPVDERLIVCDEQLPFSSLSPQAASNTCHADADVVSVGTALNFPHPDPIAVPDTVGGIKSDDMGWRKIDLDGDDVEYAKRLASETSRFAGEEQVHDLPPIFHYWSHRYLRPKLEFLGASGPDDYFANQLERALLDAPERPARFISIGAGNSDTEVRVATILKSRGVDDFILECLEITDEMRLRGRELAARSEVAHLVKPIPGDFNSWVPDRAYDAVLANQSLHHVLNLEGLLDTVLSSLRPTGRFVTSDMIGRNGHQRWPEALEIVQRFWPELPDGYRYNLQLRRHEWSFQDWDCSTEGFEGIRSQDILVLLNARFDFEDFLAFGNAIDPFIDRGFGPHFDAKSPTDRDLIDRVQASDEEAINTGVVTPTHLIATMRLPGQSGPRRWWGGLTPTSCVRPTT